MPIGLSRAGIPTVSLLPRIDCGSGVLCGYQCYATKFLIMRPAVRSAWALNSYLARYRRDVYFREIYEFLLQNKPDYFRWHVAGDILDQDYFNWMKKLAASFPKTKFLAFTKMHHLEFSRPENLAIIYSRWPGDSISRNDLPQAWMQDGYEFRAPDDAFMCKRELKCVECFNMITNFRDVILPVH